MDDSVAVTPFYLLLGKHRQQQEEKQSSVVSQVADRAQLPQASVAVKEVSESVHGKGIKMFGDFINMKVFLEERINQTNLCAYLKLDRCFVKSCK